MNNHQPSATNHQLSTTNRYRCIARRRPVFSTLFLMLQLLIVAVMVSGLSPAGAEPVLPGDTAPQRIVRIRAGTFDEAHRLSTSGIDLLEARDGDDLFALVTPDQQAQLSAAGWDVRVVPDETARLPGSHLQTFQTGYRTVVETEQFLRHMAATYPHLATLVDYGDSWERQRSAGTRGHDLLALRLTSAAHAGPRPVFFLMAAIHARELTTAEIATRFIEYLLTHYGTDAEVTWLLNEHEVVVVPIANPDGRVLAEQGYYQRKNTNNDYHPECMVPPQAWNQYGVDLNRNFTHAWGLINNPASSPPCSPDYPGPTAGSEPETQALQSFIRSLYPHRPRPADGIPAPASTSGILITLHSYGDLLLWPWGYTQQPAPNAAGLARLGTRLAEFNRYAPSQSVQLYPTSGTTDDWSYAELGLASYTFEIGPFNGMCRGFMPPYTCLDNLAGRSFWHENLPALLYAARVVHAPYSQPAGPDVRDLQVDRDTQGFTLTATIDGRGRPVATAELYIDNSPWRGGIPLALQPTDGAFDTPVEHGQIHVLLNAAQHERLITSSPGTLLLVRAGNIDGTWGPLTPIWATGSTTRLEPIWFPTVVVHP